MFPLNMPWWFFPTVISLITVIGAICWPMREADFYNPRLPRMFWIVLAMATSNVCWVVAGVLK